ncbi:amino acid adenylation domain-containing protein [Isoptericola halotolerans]|uniref:non-ribosomal peptide synthetase n=1 Tax=Isoptericola halotolerans TaxID=300560 RepID=UPI00388D38D8
MTDLRGLIEHLDGLTERQADEPAVVDASGTSTYADLRRASTRIAADLAAAGVGHGDVVGVLGPRGRRTLAAMIGVLRRGAAYMPIDQAVPRRRLATMLDVAGCGVVVSTAPDTSVAEGLVDIVDARSDESTADVPDLRDVTVPSTAEDHAYVMFTSGSTGTPKAVAVSQAGVARLATQNGCWSVGPGSRFLHASALAFDASTIEIWSSLLNGACLVAVDTDMLLAPEALREHLRHHEVDTAFFTTSLLHHLARTSPEVFDGLAQVITGGEALDARYAEVVARHVGVLINVYGPTEGTAVAIAHVVEPGAAGPVPIGRPLPYVECLLLDGDRTVSGEGTGELLIGGVGVASGYLSDPERTRERFVEMSVGESGARAFYRTGDLVRRSSDGTYEFVRRLDGQVKIRGFRIELGDVEQSLRGLDHVGEAVAVVVGEGADKRLVAVVVPAAGVRFDAAGLRARLSEVLPTYMLPNDIVQVTEIPRTQNDKADRAALQRIAAERTAAPGPDHRPRHGSVADQVAESWMATLGTSEMAPDEHYFDVGGTSLGAARLVARVQADLGLAGATGYDLIRALLSAPRLDEFTAHVMSVVAGTRSAADEIDGDADRWHGDVHLPATTPLTTAPTGDRILLTGATGFFGSYVLRDLLATTDAVVECAVRAPDPVAGRERIAEAQIRYGHGPLDAADRVVALPADLTEADLGLSPDDFDALARRTRAIHHSAAHVNFVYPYEWLRPTNVDGTRTVARLALRGGGIPVHYVSTIAVLSGMGSANVRHLSENDDVGHVERMSMGYPESKWVAEKILGLAAERGVPVSVYRPYEITGNLRDGAWNTEAAIVALFKAIVEMGLAPDARLPLDFVPADYLARALVHLAERPDHVAATYHLTNPSFAVLSDIVERLRLAGHRIRTIGYDEWVGALREFCTAHPEHPIVAFLPIFTTVAAQRDVSVKELYFEDLFPQFGRENVEAGLAGSGIECPPVDEAMLDTYIYWFHTIGWIDAPARTDVFERA